MAKPSELWPITVTAMRSAGLNSRPPRPCIARGLKPRRLDTCNPLTVIARRASAGTRAAMIPREMIRLSGEKLALRVLEADRRIPSHNLCAIWWNNESADECGNLANLAREIATG